MYGKFIAVKQDHPLVIPYAVPFEYLSILYPEYFFSYGKNFYIDGDGSFWVSLRPKNHVF